MDDERQNEDYYKSSEHANERRIITPLVEVPQQLSGGKATAQGLSRSEWRTLELPKTGNEPLKITQRLLGRGFFLIALPVPGPEFVESESLGGTSFAPCFFPGLGGVGFGAADHLGTVTLDERGGAFAGPGFTGSFEGGILKPLVVALVHIMVWLRSPVPRR